MAKLCSYYPLHFMQAVIIVNPRGLLYHVRGSREENGVGWCMANWKCHSYLFISTSRPLCACVNLVRTYTQPPQTYMIPPGCPLAAHIYFPSSTWITNLLLGEKGEVGRGGRCAQHTQSDVCLAESSPRAVIGAQVPLLVGEEINKKVLDEVGVGEKHTGTHSHARADTHYTHTQFFCCSPPFFFFPTENNDSLKTPGFLFLPVSV